MAYSESFVRYCHTAGPSYTFYKNYTNSVTYYNYSNNYYNYSDCEVCSETTGYNNHKDYTDYCYTGYSNYSNGYYYESDSHIEGTHYVNYLNGSCHESCIDKEQDYHNASYYKECVDTGCSDKYYESQYTESGCSNKYTEYSDYKDCETSGPSCSTSSCQNACQVTWSYTNYADVSNPNKGAAVTLSWTSPELIVSSGVSQLEDPKLYTAVMQELKEKINYLIANKAKNTASPDSTQITDLSTTYKSLRNSIRNLYSNLNITAPSLPDPIKYGRTQGDELSRVRNATDSLAKTTIAYTNYLNSDQSSPSGSAPSTYINAISYLNTSSSQSGSSTASGTAYARYVDYSICTEQFKYS